MQLFVSDLHLDALTPAANQQFLEFLHGQGRAAHALYILGDLFEAWIGDDDPDPAAAQICAALRSLTATGVACFALHGNRDFLLGDAFSRRTGVQLLPDPVVADFGDERVLLTHGDALCIDDRAYQELRSMVRRPEWQRRYLALPRPTRALLAGAARRGSRAHTARTVADVMDVNGAAVQAAYRATGVRRIIHGHTHRPARHEGFLDGEPVERLVLGAWYEQGSYLVRTGGQYELRTLPR
jgi:UDP-2,3-diacylglucosamine hydrolase